MKTPIFRQKGKLLVPASPLGWLLLLIVLAFAAYMFIRINKASYSTGATLINFFAVLVLVFAVYMMIAISMQLFDRRAHS